MIGLSGTKGDDVVAETERSGDLAQEEEFFLVRPGSMPSSPPLSIQEKLLTW